MVRKMVSYRVRKIKDKYYLSERIYDKSSKKVREKSLGSIDLIKQLLYEYKKKNGAGGGIRTRAPRMGNWLSRPAPWSTRAPRRNNYVPGNTICGNSELYLSRLINYSLLYYSCIDHNILLYTRFTG
jgi:hypothetical protein